MALVAGNAFGMERDYERESEPKGSFAPTITNLPEPQLTDEELLALLKQLVDEYKKSVVRKQKLLREYVDNCEQELIDNKYLTQEERTEAREVLNNIKQIQSLQQK